MVETELARRRALAVGDVHGVQIAYSTLKLVFAQADPAPTLELRPFHEVRIDGEALRSGRGGEVMAGHERHAWLVQQRTFLGVDCPSLVQLHFENEYGESSPACGPFMHFSFADGIAHGDGAILARARGEIGQRALI